MTITHYISNLPDISNYLNPKIFFILFVIFFSIDFVFIKYILNPIFQNNIKNIQGAKLDIKYLPIAISRLLTVFALYYFIITQNKSSFDAAILGFLIYGIFESTNLSLFKKWSIKAFFINTSWGTAIFFITTLIFNAIKPFI